MRDLILKWPASAAIFRLLRQTRGVPILKHDVR
jgi:hypothetical protein